MPAALLIWSPVLVFELSKYCFAAILVPAALVWSPFLDFDFSSTVLEPSQSLQRFWGPIFGTSFLKVLFSCRGDASGDQEVHLFNY